MTEITYSLDESDMLAFRRHVRRSSRAGIGHWLLYLLCSAPVAFYLGLSGFHDLLVRIVIFLFWTAVVVTFFWSIGDLFAWQFERRLYRESQKHGVLGERTIILSPDGLSYHSAVSTSLANWAGLYRIDASKTHLFIYTQPAGGYVIPRRAFPSEHDADEFLNTARQYFEEATQDASERDGAATKTRSGLPSA